MFITFYTSFFIMCVFLCLDKEVLFISLPHSLHLTRLIGTGFFSIKCLFLWACNDDCLIFIPHSSHSTVLYLDVFFYGYIMRFYSFLYHIHHILRALLFFL